MENVRVFLSKVLNMKVYLCFVYVVFSPFCPLSGERSEYCKLPILTHTVQFIKYVLEHASVCAMKSKGEGEHIVD